MIKGFCYMGLRDLVIIYTCVFEVAWSLCILFLNIFVYLFKRYLLGIYNKFGWSK